MKAKKNPTECQQLELTEVGTHRHTDCPDYDNCLDIAVGHDWPGFNCLGCSQFESEVIVPLDEEIIEEIIDFLKEHELPQKNTVYDEANCARLVKESIKRLFRTINDLKKEKECTVKRNTLKADKDQIYDQFLEKWNGQEIIIHKKITTKTKSAINAVLKNKDYSQKEIFTAIENYGIVVKSKAFYWTHKFTLEDFLKRGVSKFVHEADPLTNFKSTVAPEKKDNNPYANFSCGGD